MTNYEITVAENNKWVKTEVEAEEVVIKGLVTISQLGQRLSIQTKLTNVERGKEISRYICKL